MGVAILVTAGVITGVLFIACASGAVAALFAAATGGYLARCPRCHRVGLSYHGVVHERGCPVRQPHHLVHLPLHVHGVHGLGRSR
jgi:hypothetical protein